MLLKSALLSTTAFLPFRAAEDGSGAGESDPVVEAGRVEGTDPDPAAGQDDPAPAAAGADEAPKEDWREKEIRKKHSQIKERDRALTESQDRIRAVEAENAEMREILARRAAGGGDADPEPAPRRAPPTPEGMVSKDEVSREAQRIVAQSEFDRSCNEADRVGKATWGDKWARACGNLATLGPIDPDTMFNVMATDNPAKVLYELGSNPEEYHRVMDLPPTKRFAEMVKIAIKAEPRKRPSEAAEPVEPLGGAGGSSSGSDIYARDGSSDKMTDDDWHKKRDVDRLKNLQKRRGQAA